MTDAQALPTRSVVVPVLKLTVSAALMTFLLSRTDTGILWTTARRASAPWLSFALVIYGLNVLASTWRWRLLLDAQRVRFRKRSLLASYLVAGFFNNFLPSNIGGDVVRVRDTAPSFGSKTRATTVILVDRGIGLIGLVLVAACGATMAAAIGAGPVPIWPTWLWGAAVVGVATAAPAILAPARIGRLLQPLAVLNPDWVGERIGTLTETLTEFRRRPLSLAWCFAGAIVVQVLLVLYYRAVASALHIDVRLWDLAVVVPVSFLVQMLPLSVNGFGVREATFSYYLGRIGVSIESAVLLPLVATALMMAFSVTGAAVYVARGRVPAETAVPDGP